MIGVVNSSSENLGPIIMIAQLEGFLVGLSLLFDTFNENSPPTSDPEFISSLGSAVYKAMSKADKDAVWLMQGWLFYSDSSFWKPPQMKVYVAQLRWKH